MPSNSMKVEIHLLPFVAPALLINTYHYTQDAGNVSEEAFLDAGTYNRPRKDLLTS